MNNNRNIKDVLDVSSNIFFNENKMHEKNDCQHEWIKDLIDIDPEKSQMICYCVKCELTKN
jgi:hypothetical protein